MLVNLVVHIMLAKDSWSQSGRTLQLSCWRGRLRGRACTLFAAPRRARTPHILVADVQLVELQLCL